MNAQTQILDSRDLIEELEDYDRAISEEENPEIDAERAEKIRGLIDCVEDWPYGATFIREDYFTEYAQELAEDIGALNPDAGWPASYIDWEAAADALKSGYTPVQFDGSTWYVR